MKEMRKNAEEYAKPQSILKYVLGEVGGEVVKFSGLVWGIKEAVDGDLKNVLLAGGVYVLGSALSKLSNCQRYIGLFSAGSLDLEDRLKANAKIDTE